MEGWPTDALASVTAAQVGELEGRSANPFGKAQIALVVLVVLVQVDGRRAACRTDPSQIYLMLLSK